MFDSLLCGKFSNKCKHAIKCVNSRMVPIRNKKQAMLRFLKKDVADLLAHGHDSNALGRIDALIVEINQMSCYDMIEQYCTLVLKQLPVLRKQRECPQEAMDAVSTLIFAAARFPDLPELCDLRQAFTERYGGQMEPFVNAEFVEKIQKKSFSAKKKINLMQYIAEEYSINWNSEKLGIKLSSSAHSFDDPKKSLSVSNENEQPIKLQNGKHGMTMDIPYEEKSANGNTPLRGSTWRPQIKPEEANVISSIKKEDGNMHDFPIKTEKLFADETENREPRYNDIALPPSMKVKDQHTRTNKDDVSEDFSHHKHLKAQDPSIHSGRKNGKYNDVVGGVFSYDRMSKGQESLIDGDLGKQLKDPIQLRKDRSSYIVPPYTKSKKSLSSSKKEERHDHLIYNEPNAEEVQDACERRNVTQQNDRSSSMISSHSKPEVTKFPELNGNGKQIESHNPSLASSGCGVPNGRKDKSNPERLCDEEKSKPRSVRKKYSKLGDVENFLNDSSRSRIPRDKQSTDTTLGDACRELKTVGHRLSILAVDEEDNAIDYGKLLIRSSGGQRKQQGIRQNCSAYDADCDQEEKIMDKLLIHYSKKAMCINKPLIRAIPANQFIANDEVSSVHQRGKTKNSVTTETLHLRAASFPPEPLCSDDVARPTRATSMHPDLLSPNMGRVHPNLPNYDELAARLNLLRKT